MSTVVKSWTIPHRRFRDQGFSVDKLSSGKYNLYCTRNDVGVYTFKNVTKTFVEQKTGRKLADYTPTFSNEEVK